MVNKLNSKEACLVLDGLGDVNLASTIGTCFKCLSTGEVYHYETIDKKRDTASSEYLDMSLEIINKTEQKIGCKVTCIVTTMKTKCYG